MTCATGLPSVDTTQHVSTCHHSKPCHVTTFFQVSFPIFRPTGYFPPRDCSWISSLCPISLCNRFLSLCWLQKTKFIDCQRSKHSLLNWRTTLMTLNSLLLLNKLTTQLRNYFRRYNRIPLVDLQFFRAYSMCLAGQVPTQSQRATCVDRWLNPNHKKNACRRCRRDVLRVGPLTHVIICTLQQVVHNTQTHKYTHTHWMNINTDIE